MSERVRPRGRPRRGVLLAVAVAAVTAAGVAVWALWFSSLLTLRVVRVRGGAILPAEQIEQVADLPVGRQLARLDVGAAQRRVATLAPVAQARVRRDWPHTVVITVVEREAVAVTPTSDGRFDEVDRTGVRFNTVGRPPPGVPLIVPGPGGISHDALTAALGVATGLPESTLGRVRSISADGPNNVSLTLANGATVRWGGADDGQRKAQVLAVLLRYGARWYDVSAPDAPAYR